MFTSEQYRAKALEYGDLVRSSANANEKHEYQKLQQRFAELKQTDDALRRISLGMQRDGDAQCFRSESRLVSGFLTAREH
jgi:hypothetical protein